MFNNKSKAEEVAENVRETAKQVRKAAKKNAPDLSDVRHDVRKQVKATRRDWSIRLQNLASDLRWEIEHLLDADDKKRADRVAHDLEKIAHNIERRASHQLSDASSTFRSNMWRTLFATFVVGLVVGIILKNRNGAEEQKKLTYNNGTYSRTRS